MFCKSLFNRSTQAVKKSRHRKVWTISGRGAKTEGPMNGIISTIEYFSSCIPVSIGCQALNTPIKKKLALIFWVARFKIFTYLKLGRPVETPSRAEYVSHTLGISNQLQEPAQRCWAIQRRWGMGEEQRDRQMKTLCAERVGQSNFSQPKLPEIIFWHLAWSPCCRERKWQLLEQNTRCSESRSSRRGVWMWSLAATWRIEDKCSLKSFTKSLWLTHSLWRGWEWW